MDLISYLPYQCISIHLDNIKLVPFDASHTYILFFVSNVKEKIKIYCNSQEVPAQKRKIIISWYDIRNVVITRNLRGQKINRVSIDFFPQCPFKNCTLLMEGEELRKLGHIFNLMYYRIQEKKFGKSEQEAREAIRISSAVEDSDFGREEDEMKLEASSSASSCAVIPSSCPSIEGSQEEEVIYAAASVEIRRTLEHTPYVAEDTPPTTQEQENFIPGTPVADPAIPLIAEKTYHIYEDDFVTQETQHIQENQEIQGIQDPEDDIIDNSQQMENESERAISPLSEGDYGEIVVPETDYEGSNYSEAELDNYVEETLSNLKNIAAASQEIEDPQEPSPVDVVSNCEEFVNFEKLPFDVVPEKGKDCSPKEANEKIVLLNEKAPSVETTENGYTVPEPPEIAPVVEEIPVKPAVRRSRRLSSVAEPHPMEQIIPEINNREKETLKEDFVAQKVKSSSNLIQDIDDLSDAICHSNDEGSQETPKKSKITNKKKVLKKTLTKKLPKTKKPKEQNKDEAIPENPKAITEEPSKLQTPETAKKPEKFKSTENLKGKPTTPSNNRKKSPETSSVSTKRLADSDSDSDSDEWTPKGIVKRKRQRRSSPAVEEATQKESFFSSYSHGTTITKTRTRIVTRSTRFCDEMNNNNSDAVLRKRLISFYSCDSDDSDDFIKPAKVRRGNNIPLSTQNSNSPEDKLKESIIVQNYSQSTSISSLSGQSIHGTPKRRLSHVSKTPKELPKSPLCFGFVKNKQEFNEIFKENLSQSMTSTSSMSSLEISEPEPNKSQSNEIPATDPKSKPYRPFPVFTQESSPENVTRKKISLKKNISAPNRNRSALKSIENNLLPPVVLPSLPSPILDIPKMNELNVQPYMFQDIPTGKETKEDLLRRELKVDQLIQKLDNLSGKQLSEKQFFLLGIEVFSMCLKCIHNMNGKKEILLEKFNKIYCSKGFQK